MMLHPSRLSFGHRTIRMAKAISFEKWCEIPSRLAYSFVEFSAPGCWCRGLVLNICQPSLLPLVCVRNRGSEGGWHDEGNK